MRIRAGWRPGIFVILPLAVTFASAKAQYCNDNSGNSPYICIDWSQSTDPIRDTNFRFDFSDPDNPGVEFLTGDSGWVVWSQVSSSNTSPAALGDVTIDPEPSSADSYIVKIHNAGTNGPGATTCGKIDLTSAASGWSGHTAVSGGAITGNLTGDLKVKKAGTSGGGVTFSIGGDMTGNIDIDHIAAGGLTICGDFGSTSVRRTITIGEIQNGNLSIGDLIEATINVTTLDGKTIQIAESADATLIANYSQI